MVNNGFIILESNYYTRYGEIDIIAKKNDIYHFIEVKSVVNYSFIDPILKITHKKLSRIYKGIAIYLSSNNLDAEYCVDLVIIRGNDLEFLCNVSL